MNRLWLALVPLLLAVPCFAERTVVLSATPMMKCVTCPDQNCFGSPAYSVALSSPPKADCVMLSPSQQQESRVVLLRQVEGADTLYVWESREGRQVVKITNPTGLYDLYINDAGFIKVERSWAALHTLIKDVVPFSYMEVLHQNLQTITYWGIVSSYDP